MRNNLSSVLIILRVRYYAIAKDLLNFPNCRSLFEVQALLMLALFYLHHAQMTDAYAVCSFALTCSLQIGMHRNLNLDATLLEIEMRRRTFFTIRRLQMYLNAVLGLPKAMQDIDVDQKLPLEIDDAQLSAVGINTHISNCQSCTTAIANAATPRL